LFFIDELKELASSYTPFEYDICVSRASDQWKGGLRCSPVDALAEAMTHEKSAPDIYVCGSSALVKGVGTLVDKLGLPRERLHHEYYLPSATTTSGSAQEAPRSP
jgi:ferredoxin-NADP reductase